MEALLSLPALILIALLGSGSIKVTSGGRSRLVERLGVQRGHEELGDDEAVVDLPVADE